MTGGYRWILSRALKIPLVFLAIGVRGLLRRREPVPGDPEGVRADRGPRRHHHPDHRAGGREPRLHPRAGAGGRAGDQAAPGPGRRRLAAQPGRAGLPAAGPRQRRHRHRAPGALGPAHGEAAGRGPTALRLGDEFPWSSRLPDQPALPRPARLRAAAGPVRDRRPGLRHPQGMDRPRGAAGAGDRALRQPRHRLQGVAAGRPGADRPLPGRRPRRLHRGHRQDAGADVRRARGLHLRQPRRRVPGDHARPRPGPGDLLRPRQHLHPGDRTATSSPSPPSSR